MAEIKIGNFERGCRSQPLEEFVDLRQCWVPWNGFSAVCFADNGADTRAKAKIRLVFHTQSRNSTGRWDRNRTCNLRVWSLLPYVRERSGAYTKWLETAHFDARKYVDVPQSSPALA